MNTQLQEFLAKHAISEKIGGHGRYVVWKEGDDISSHFDGYDPKIERLAKTVAGQTGGIIINRRGWKQQVPPQLRPVTPVPTSNGRKWSFHPSDSSQKYTRVKTKKGDWITVSALPLGVRDRHITKWHPDGNVEHPHLTPPRRAKYVLPPGAHGKRLDVPMPERILRAERVFFVIEGSLKTDAILSTGEAAFGVPSVTLWDAPELSDFIQAMNLRSKQVVIVPDADWITNPMVIMQAMLLRTYLREHGIDTVIAAPPLANDEVMVDPVHGALKGVDDFLVAGHSLDELSVLEREPADPVALWGPIQGCGFRTLATALNAVEALRRLSLHADGNGQLVRSVSTFAKILDCGRKEARKRVEDLSLAEVIEVEGDLAADFQWEDPSGAPHDYDWDDRPRITLKPRVRAKERPVPLRDLPVAREQGKEAIHRVESGAC